MSNQPAPVWGGLSVIGGFIVGIVAFLAGILAVFNEFNYIGAGLCFLAAAIAFGLLANSIFPKWKTFGNRLT